MQTTFDSVGELTAALRRAPATHVVHEERTGEAGAAWPDWYAEYMDREHAGETVRT